MILTRSITTKIKIKTLLFTEQQIKYLKSYAVLALQPPPRRRGFTTDEKQIELYENCVFHFRSLTTKLLVFCLFF